MLCTRSHCSDGSLAGDERQVDDVGDEAARHGEYRSLSLLGAEGLLDGEGEVGAALDGGVVGDDHHRVAGHPAG